MDTITNLVGQALQRAGLTVSERKAEETKEIAEVDTLLNRVYGRIEDKLGAAHADHNKAVDHFHKLVKQTQDDLHAIYLQHEQIDKLRQSLAKSKTIEPREKLQLELNLQEKQVELDALHQQHAASANELNAAKDTIVQLGQTMAQHDANYKQLQQDKEILTSQLSEIKQKLDASSADHAGLQQSKADLTLQLSDAQSSVAALTQQLSAATQQRDLDNTEITSLKAQIAVLESKTRDMQQTIDSFAEDLLKNKAQTEQVTKELEQVQSRLAESNTSLASKSEELVKCQQNLKKCTEDHDSHIARMTNSLSNVPGTQTVDEVVSKLQQLQQENKALSDEHRTLVDEHDRLSQEHQTELSSGVSRTAQLQTVNNELQAELAKLNSTHDSLKTDSTDAASKLSSLEAELAIHVTKEKELNDRIAAQVQQINDLESQHDRESKKITELQTNTGELDKSIETFKTQVQQLTTQNSELQKEVESILAELEEHDKTAAKMANSALDDLRRIRTLEADAKIAAGVKEQLDKTEALNIEQAEQIAKQQQALENEKQATLLAFAARQEAELKATEEARQLADSHDKNMKDAQEEAERVRAATELAIAAAESEKKQIVDNLNEMLVARQADMDRRAKEAEDAIKEAHAAAEVKKSRLLKEQHDLEAVLAQEKADALAKQRELQAQLDARTSDAIAAEAARQAREAEQKDLVESLTLKLNLLDESKRSEVDRLSAEISFLTTQVQTMTVTHDEMAANVKQIEIERMELISKLQDLEAKHKLEVAKNSNRSRVIKPYTMISFLPNGRQRRYPPGTDKFMYQQ